MEALADYEAALVNYQNSMSVWNSMSVEEQALANANAEEWSIGGYAGIIGFLVGVVIWIALARTQSIDALIGITILAISTSVFTIVKPIRVIVGRSTRLIFHAAIYFILLWMLGAIVSIWSPLLKANASELTIALAVVVLVLSIYLEVSGGAPC
jgi:hypothetical protein